MRRAMFNPRRAMLPLAVAVVLSACGGSSSDPAPAAQTQQYPVVYGGPSAPTADVGRDGDFFINATTGEMYGPKTAGAWPTATVSLVGPAGPGGATGATGATGAVGGEEPAGPSDPGPDRPAGRPQLKRVK